MQATMLWVGAGVTYVKLLMLTNTAIILWKIQKQPSIFLNGIIILNSCFLFEYILKCNLFL